MHKWEGGYYNSTPDMKKVAIGLGGEILIWDSESEKELLRVPAWDYSQFSFSPDGKKIVMGRYDSPSSLKKEIQIWDVESGKELVHLDAASHYFFPDGKRFATVSPNGVQIWDAESGKELLKIEGGFTDVYPISRNFSPDGKKFATRDQTRINTIRDIESGKELLKAEGIFYGFSPDGKKVFTYTLDNTVNDWVTHVWDIESGKELYKLEGSPSDGFSPDGKIIVTRKTGHDMRMWDVDSGRELHKLRGQSGKGFSPDGKKFFTSIGSGVYGNDGTSGTSMWDVETGKEMQLRGDFSGFSDDGKKVITSIADPEDDEFSQLEFLWDIETGRELTQGWEGITVAFSPEGKIVTCSTNNIDRNWTVRIGESESEEGLSFMRYFVGFSPDRKKILVNLVDAGYNIICDAESGEDFRIWKGGGLYSTFSPDGKKIAMTDKEGITRIWDWERLPPLPEE